jgi:hypothetical protein
MLIRIVKFRKTQGAALVFWGTWKLYSTLVGKCFETAIWKTGEIRAYYNEDMYHMSDRWPFK